MSEPCVRIVRNLLRAPLALGYWLGVGQTRAIEKGGDIIFLCHGTPRRSAATLERQLRYVRRVFTLVRLAERATSICAERLSGRRRRAAIVFDDDLIDRDATDYRAVDLMRRCSEAMAGGHVVQIAIPGDALIRGLAGDES